MKGYTKITIVTLLFLLIAISSNAQEGYYFANMTWEQHFNITNPKYTIYDTITITLNNSDPYCLQTNSTDVLDCGGVVGGQTFRNGTWNGAEGNLFDAQEWSTSYCLSSTCNQYVNRTYPANNLSTINDKIMVHYYTNPINYDHTNMTVPLTCKGTKLQLWVASTSSGADREHKYYCYNYTSGEFDLFYTETMGLKYLSDIMHFWAINSSVGDIYLTINNSKIFDDSKELFYGESISTDLNNLTVLQEYVNYCYDTSSGNCTTPINLSNNISKMLGYSISDASTVRNYFNTIVRDEDNSIIDSIDITVKSITLDTNPDTIGKVYFNHSETASFCLTDTDEEYLDSCINYVINYSDTYLNFTVVNNYFALNFSEAVDISIQHVNGTSSYAGITLLQLNQTSFPAGKVSISFKRSQDTYYRQRYEFINDYTSVVNESIWVMANPDISRWYQIFDLARSPRSDADVYLYAINTSWGNTTYKMTGRYLSDDEGYVNIYTDDDYWFNVEVDLDEYAQSTTLYEKANVSNDKTSALAILMSRTLGDIFSYSVEFPKYFSNRSASIEGSVLYLPNQDIKLKTDYMDTNDPYLEGTSNTIAWLMGGYSNQLGLLQNTYAFTLLPDVHFNSTGTSNITLNLYKGSDLFETRTIEYFDTTSDTIADIDTSGMDKKLLNPLLLLGLVFVAVIMQFAFKVEQGSLGLDTFMIGCIFLPLFSSSYIILAFICGGYYVVSWMKPVIGVTS